MSMKRAKEVKRRGRDTDDKDRFFTSKVTGKTFDWEKDVAAQPDGSFTKYGPKDRFAREQLLVHTKFGKGVVIDVEPSRVEVLFQDGPKKLAHGLV